MHPILQRSTSGHLEAAELPQIASAAMNDSMRDVARLHVLARSMPEDQILGLLPVFFANLDPALIPSLETLDEILTTSTRLPAIQNAEESLSSLAIVLRTESFPLDAAPEIWPRIWKWIEFLQLYHDCAPGLTTDQIYLICTQFILQLSEHEPTSAVISATEGVRHILAVAWATGVWKRYDEDNPTTLQAVSVPLAEVVGELAESQHLAEVVDACGGSYTALARTLTSNIYQLARHAKLDIVAAAVAPVFFFLLRSVEISPEFWACLLSHGIVPALVSALEIDGIG
ncbi:hypothetical protein C8R46DRAFT_1223951 [Mycena filopes]|nr:hypothetical protein C8R46DRAFT_1223951 [Mycena filopes]